eukprot:scaffold62347_cov28-Tisochrysis_lutea.AAC.2
MSSGGAHADVEYRARGYYVRSNRMHGHGLLVDRGCALPLPHGATASVLGSRHRRRSCRINTDPYGLTTLEGCRLIHEGTSGTSTVMRTLHASPALCRRKLPGDHGTFANI